MAAGQVPTSNLSALYLNTTNGVIASPSAVDAGIQDIVSTVNANATDFNNFTASTELPVQDGSITTAKLRDGAVTPSKIVAGAVTQFAYSKSQTDTLLAGVVAGSLPQATIDAIALSATEQAKDYTDAQIVVAETYTDNQIVTHTKDYVRQPAFAATTGTSTAYAVTLSPAPLSIPEGFGITVVLNVTCGNAPTLNVNAYGASTMKKQDGTAYTAGDMIAGKPYTFRKVGSDFLADSGSGGVIIAGQTEESLVFSDTITAGDPVYTNTTFTKLANPATLPTGSSSGVAVSTDGVYMAVGVTVYPFIVIYKRSGDVFTKLSDPSTLPAGVVTGVNFSSDGVYLSVSHATTPFVTIYKRSGDVFTKLANPATLPTGTAYSVSFSADVTYLTVAHDITPFVTIYKRSGDVFTKLTNPSTLPTGTCMGVTFSSDGVYLVVSHQPTPYVTIYKRSGDVFTKLTNPSTLPTGNGSGVAFSTDVTYLVVTHNTTPFITIYKRSADTFTKLTNPTALPAATSVIACSFSPDGSYLTVMHDSASPYILIYRRTGDTFLKIDNPSTLPTGIGRGVTFSTDGVYMPVAHDTTPFVTIYKVAYDTVYKSLGLMTDFVATKTGAGYAKESGIPGDTKKIIRIWR